MANAAAGKRLSRTKGKVRRFSFHGQGGTLFGIQIVNLFLTLATLGLYSFWGRVRVRNYIWGQVEFEGDRLSYHGTAPELLLGWVKAALVFGIPYVLLRNGPQFVGANRGLQLAAAMASGLLVIIFIPFATVGSRRYRLSRTAWRSVRFSFRGAVNEYAFIFLWGSLLKIVTLGLYSPFYDAKRDKFLIENSWIGTQRFRYTGKGEDLFGKFFLSLILALPTLGFSLIWYYVKRTVYVWNHTFLGRAGFNCDITLGGLLKVDFINILLVIGTLGFGLPWAKVRSMNYMLDHLALARPLNLRSIRQDSRTALATGDEMADFLNLEFDLG